MTAILPADVSVKLVRLALIKEREAKEYQHKGWYSHAAAAEREARECRDIIAAHDEAMRQRILAAEARLARPVDLRGVLA